MNISVRDIHMCMLNASYMALQFCVLDMFISFDLKTER